MSVSTLRAIFRPEGNLGTLFPSLLQSSVLADFVEMHERETPCHA